MVAHVCGDVVLHLLVPLLVGWVRPGQERGRNRRRMHRNLGGRVP